MNKELAATFEQLKTDCKLTEQEMIACWLEFIAERARTLAIEGDQK